MNRAMQSDLISGTSAAPLVTNFFGVMPPAHSLESGLFGKRTSDRTDREWKEKDVRVDSSGSRRKVSLAVMR